MHHVAFSAHNSFRYRLIRMILSEKVFINVFAMRFFNHVDWTIIGGDIVLLRYQAGRHVRLWCTMWRFQHISP